MFSSLEFFIVEAFRSIRRGGLMTSVAVVTIAVSLTIFGTFLLLVLNLGNIVSVVSSRMDLTAYTQKDLSLDEAAAIQLKLSRLPGVEKVEFTSKTEAWNKFKGDFGGKFALDEVIRENPLPHTFAVQVRTPDQLTQVARTISNLADIDEVRYSGQLIKQMQTLVGAVRLGGLSLVILLSLATLLIVVNTIRLTVLARETDLYIMKLVGATNSFVKWPFIIEGVIIGLLGGGVACLVLKVSYESTVLRLTQALPFLPLVGDTFLLTAIYAVTVIGGMALGIMGGYISVSRALKNEV
ncbi:MAG: permease-like cell division protein FtsX [Candidatus Margulisbacteria bacterium]|jgi:cell division transport system permease protein|nr:permease-like cell division protein FtsX [Candidatus Margulisiibacteriota bacterium]